MDFQHSKLTYDADRVRIFIDWTLHGFDVPVSGDDMARLKSGHRA